MDSIFKNENNHAETVTRITKLIDTFRAEINVTELCVDAIILDPDEDPKVTHAMSVQFGRLIDVTHAMETELVMYRDALNKGIEPVVMSDEILKEIFEKAGAANAYTVLHVKND